MYLEREIGEYNIAVLSSLISHEFQMLTKSEERVFFSNSSLIHIVYLPPKCFFISHMVLTLFETVSNDASIKDLRVSASNIEPLFEIAKSRNHPICTQNPFATHQSKH